MYRRISYLALLMALLCSPLLHAEVLPAHIIKVIDGDTVKVQDANGMKYLVSLSGVDAPEIMQAHGKVAKEYLCQLICDKEVVLSFNKLNTEGHVLSTVYLNGADISLVMLKNGMAWQNMRDQEVISRHHYSNYARAENNARIMNAGLWHDGINISPWRWRQISQASIWE